MHHEVKSLTFSTFLKLSQKMAKKILTIGFDIGSDDTTFEDFTSKTSLLDWDIILFKPNILKFITYHSQYKGKPNLGDNDSFRLKEASEHWRREIKQACESGKTVIVFLSAVNEVYIDTGERQYSGTGKNRATTRVVTPYNNYHSLPVKLTPANSRGSSIKLASKGAEVLAPYLAEFGAFSEYQVILNELDIPACLLTRNGEKPVGALYRSKASNGSILCLPDIDFYKDEFTEEGEDEDGDIISCWSTEGRQFAHKLIKSVISLDAALRSTNEMTPTPEWAIQSIYELKTEREIHAQLLEVETRLEAIQQQKEAFIEQLSNAGQLRGLLYEKGKPLEQAIIEALRLMGFSAHQFKEGSSEFDVVFESGEGRLIGEAEGKDGKAINVDKLRQLAMNIHEDLQREEISVPAKGVLFGNGYRLTDPELRDIAFTEKCVSAAKSSSTALVATHDLFKVARHLSDHNDPDFAAECRKAILSSIGITNFPKPSLQEEPEKISEVNGRIEKAHG